MKNILERFKELVSYSLPVKLIIGYGMTALGSASALGLLSEFAVYNYALFKGFRVPVEGVAYLNQTVTLISALIIFTLLIVFFFTYIFARLTTKLLLSNNVLLPFWFHRGRFAIPEKLEHIRRSNFWEAFIVAMIGSITMTAALTIIIEYPISLVSIIIHMAEYKMQSDIFGSFYIKMAFFIVAFLSYLTVFKPNYIKYVAISVILVVLISIVSAIFHVKFYSNFLKAAGFGGERDITLFLNIKENELKIYGKLLLKSNDYYILLLPNQKIVEYPISKIDRVEYSQLINISSLE
ncbi:hypothetical protein ACLIN6_003656 [Vibrio cholerae]|uniref:hypothetical protein n=1 Tax=Vibrio cholerae TaxID=666 RepID=UPI000E0C8FBF|nr:hypothetical protein [Vibrio cholerae]EGR4126321.1 hypothetical protein [Vibrio cholerae]ELJ8564581.1 hypothetical protein [Vibrio cholerae]HAS3612895.1 hypothetical protein [Vibrio cholerae]